MQLSSDLRTAFKPTIFRYSVLVLVALLIPSLVAAQSQPQPPGKLEQATPPQPQILSGQQKAAAEERGTEQSPFVVRSIKSAEETAKDEQERKDKVFNDNVTIFLGIIVAVSALLQCGALAVTILTARRQVRAYVSVTKALIVGNEGMALKEPFENISEGKLAISMMSFKNNGQTPAYDVAVFGTIALVKWPLNPKDLKPFDRSEGFSKTIIGPGVQLTKLDAKAPQLTGEDIQGISGGSHAIFVYGEVTYKDVFRSKRFLRYRYFIGGDVGLRGQSLSAHDEGNEADN